MRRPVLFAATLGVLAACSPRPPVPSPNEVARRLYSITVGEQLRGLPNAGQRPSLFPLLTPELAALFDAAQRQQDVFIAAHPDEKPPWIDGDLFSSLFEGAQTFEVDSSTVRDSRADVPVHLTYADSSNTTQWTDTLVLTLLGGTWLVDDIAFGGTWPFRTGGSLRRVLASR